MDKYPASIKLIVEKQITIWHEILSISREKLHLVTKDGLDLNIEQLNLLLLQQQERIEAIDALNREKEAEFKKLDQVGIKMTCLKATPEYQKAEDEIRKIALLIKENDNIIESQIRQLQQQIQTKLWSFRENKKAKQIYLQDNYSNEGWFIDQKK